MENYHRIKFLLNISLWQESSIYFIDSSTSIYYQPMIIQMLFKGPLFKVYSLNLKDHSCLCYMLQKGYFHLVILFYRKTFKIAALLFVIAV